MGESPRSVKVFSPVKEKEFDFTGVDATINDRIYENNNQINMSENNITPLPVKPKFVGLTNAKAIEISGALARLKEISNAAPTILAPGAVDNQAEAAELINYLANNLIEHGAELIGGFIALKTEYGPLVAALLPIFNRVTATIAQAQANETKN